jgi:hypothetical protein
MPNTISRMVPVPRSGSDEKTRNSTVSMPATENAAGGKPGFLLSPGRIAGSENRPPSRNSAGIVDPLAKKPSLPSYTSAKPMKKLITPRPRITRCRIVGRPSFVPPPCGGP